jgi:asparagine synthase (glutamine-hydrolysing)
VRDHVTVALSGDGGDETFAGYERYDWGLKLDRYRQLCPVLLRQLACQAVDRLPVAVLAAAAQIAGARGQHPAHRLQRAARLGAAASLVDGYRQFLSQTIDPQAILVMAGEHNPAAYQPGACMDGLATLPRMQAIDATSYLPDDILVKVDRTSMSTGLEVRVPLLDHRIWEWSARLPGGMQRSDGKGKAVLRAILGKYVPAQAMDRPKAGFSVPLANWLRMELREWAEEFLEPSRLAESGLFRVSAVRELWQRHLSGREDHGPLIWSILMLESWRQSVLHA